MVEKRVATRESVNLLPATISKEQAMFLLKSIWPKAPEADVVKAAILCKQYGLNPLMKQVYLIEFDTYEGYGEKRHKIGEDWAIVLGIKATRLIAQQALKKLGIRYSYLDGPRVMTEAEQKAIRGKVEPDKIWAITILQNSHGDKFPGYGSYEANKKPYGSDKGNDATNMAFIRSERNATDKMAPGALPDIETGDDTYIEGDFKVAIELGRKQFDEQVEKDTKELWTGDASFTTESATKQGTAPEKGEVVAEPVQGAVTAESHEAAAGPIDLGWLKESLAKVKWKNAEVVSWLGSKTESKGLILTGSLSDIVKRMTPAQAAVLSGEIQDRLLMSK